MSEDTARANPKPHSVERLSQVWRRINDHTMVQWSVGYIALAYGVQHARITRPSQFACEYGTLFAGVAAVHSSDQESSIPSDTFPCISY